MNFFKQHFGLDVIDVAVQVVVTGLAMGFIDSATRGPAAEGMMMAAAGFSVVVFAVRRRRALARGPESVGLTTGQMAAARLEELEGRVAQLESAEVRVLELEERLDFAERMLARTSGERTSLPGNQAIHG